MALLVHGQSYQTQKAIYITQGCNKTLCFYVTFFRLQLAALSGLYKAILEQTIMSASKVNMQFVCYK